MDGRSSATALGSGEAEELVNSIMSSVRTVSQERRGRAWLTGGLAGSLALASVAVLVVGGVIAYRSIAGPIGRSPAMATFHQEGLTFDYPAAWTTSPGSDAFGIVAFVGSVPATTSCVTAHDDRGVEVMECHTFLARLGDGDAVVRVASIDAAWWEPGSRIPTWPDAQGDDGIFYGEWRSIVVAGVPSKVRTGPVVPNDWLRADRATMLLLPSLRDLGRYYLITIVSAGSGADAIDAHAALVDRLIASIRLDPPPSR